MIVYHASASPIGEVDPSRPLWVAEHVLWIRPEDIGYQAEIDDSAVESADDIVKLVGRRFIDDLTANMSLEDMLAHPCFMLLRDIQVVAFRMLDYHPQDENRDSISILVLTPGCLKGWTRYV